MMFDVIIIGAGGHAAEIDEYIQFNKQVKKGTQLNVVGFLDDMQENYNKYQFSAPLLGDISNHVIRHHQAYLIGIANLKYRRYIVEKFINGGGKFESFVHCNAYISKSASIGIGSIICPHVNIGPNVNVGNYTLINSRCSLGHDTTIGDYNFISPNVCFSGHTTIGSENLFGINSASIPGISIGNRNKIAAGMILDQNLGDETVVFHRFKEKVIAVPKK